MENILGIDLNQFVTKQVEEKINQLEAQVDATIEANSDLQNKVYLLDF